MSNSFKICFEKEEMVILKKHNIYIINNERNYCYSSKNKTVIYNYGSPTYFKYKDFNWSGGSWKSLMFEFISWFLDNTDIDNENLLSIKLSFSKQYIFSKENKTNHLGPFKNGLYVNGNHSGTHMWWQIINLLNFLQLNLNEDAQLFIHYPSLIEPSEVANLIWKKEIILFRQYLFDVGYKKDIVAKFIEYAKNTNTIYKKITENYLFFTQDRMNDIYNSISKLKLRFNTLLDDNFFNTFIENFLDFKKEIFYEDITF